MQSRTDGHTHTELAPAKRSRSASRARRSVSIIAAAIATGAMAFGGGAAATAAPDSDVERYVTGASANAVESYWTPDRMENAKNLDKLVVDVLPDVTSAVEAGAPTQIAGQVAKTLKGESAGPNAVTPVSHIGKVFFTLGGSDYVCSGNSVASANGNTVSTAGHCLNEGGGSYATNFAFAPAYENGQKPYGVWTATELLAPRAWAQNGDINYDTGFAVVRAPGGSGATLADTVGASGVAFNQARGLQYQAYGYPAGAPFDGETLQTCSGTAQQDTYNRSQSQGIPCDMTGGSSGGPWFIGSGSGGAQNSVNSFGYNAVPDVMWGPYWGSVIQSTYSAAQS